MTEQTELRRDVAVSHGFTSTRYWNHPGERRCRSIVYCDAYERQSHGEVHLFTGRGWELIVRFPGERLAAAKFSYVLWREPGKRTPEMSDAMEQDVRDMIKEAEFILG